MSFLKDARYRNAIWEALTVPSQLFFKTKWWGQKVEGLLVLITGASQGIGAGACIHAVCKQGDLISSKLHYITEQSSIKGLSVFQCSLWN